MADEVDGNGKDKVWAVLGPLIFLFCGALLTALLSSTSKTNDVLATQQTASVARHEILIEAMKAKQASDSERLKGIETDMSYVKQQTSETSTGVKELQKQLLGVRR